LPRDSQPSSRGVVLQACPVAPELDAGELAALLAAPGAISWSLDVL
jgi:hypothetical protein